MANIRLVPQLDPNEEIVLPLPLELAWDEGFIRVTAGGRIVWFQLPEIFECETTESA